MTNPWRYGLPCGHVNYRTLSENAPERRYQCLSCSDFFGEDELVDRKEVANAQ